MKCETDRELKKKILNNTKWLTLFALTGRSSWLVTIFLVAHALGPSAFGEISVSLSFWLIAGRMFGFGIEIWVNRSIASVDCDARKRLYAGAALSLRFFLLTVSFVLILFFTLIVNINITATVIIFACFSLRQMAESLREVLVGILQGYEKMKLQTLCLIPCDVFQLMLCWVMAVFFSVQEPLPFVIIFTCVSVGKVFLLIIISHRHLEIKFFQNFVVLLNYKDVLKESFFLGLSILLALALGKVDVILLGSMTNSAVVGNYSAAYIFLDACVVFFGVIRQALFPNLSRLSTVSKQTYRSLTIKSSLVFFLFGVLGCLIMIFIGPFVFLVLGGGFDSVPVLLRWLALSLPFVALSGSLGGAIIAAGQARSAVVVQAVGLIFNLVANCLWIPGFQAAGAAWATTLTYLMTSMGYIVVFQKFCRGCV